MNKTGSAAKVKLNSFDDLFGDGQPQAGIEQVQEIALSELHEFKGHPFKVLDDEKLQERVQKPFKDIYGFHDYRNRCLIWWIRGK